MYASLEFPSADIRRFTPGQRVFWMVSEITDWAAGGPDFRDFTTLIYSPLTQTRDAFVQFRETQKADIQQD